MINSVLTSRSSAVELSSTSSHAGRGSMTTCPTVEEIALWRTSFDSLLDSSLGMDLFTYFLQHEHSEENIIFWRQCAFYRKSSSRGRLAQFIYDEFIDVLAPSQINVDAEIRNDITDRLRDAPLDLFDEARKHITQLMRRDSYRRFIEMAELGQLPQSKQRQNVLKGPTVAKTHQRLRLPWRSHKSKLKEFVSATAVGSEKIGHHDNSERVAVTENDARDRESPKNKPRKKSKSSSSLISRLVTRFSAKFSSAEASDSSQLLGSPVGVHHVVNSTVCTTSTDDVTILTSRDISLLETTLPHSAGVESASTLGQRQRSCSGCREKSLSTWINYVGRLDRSSTNPMQSRLQRFRQLAFERRAATRADVDDPSQASDDVERLTVPLENISVSGARHHQHRRHLHLRTLVGSLTTRRQSDSGISSASDDECGSELRSHSLRPSDDDVRRLTIYFM